MATDFIDLIKDIRDVKYPDIVEKHADIEAAKSEVDASQAQISSDKAIVAADKATVASDKVTVAADKAEVVIYKEQVLSDKAIVAADKATVAADKVSVATDKAQVAADKTQVSLDASSVATDKGIVAADKGIVAGYKSAVAEDKDAVELDRAEVALNKAAVASDKESVESSKSSISVMKSDITAIRDEIIILKDGTNSIALTVQGLVDLAQLWAEADENVVVADGKYSAKHWAQKAYDVVVGEGVQAFIDLIDSPTNYAGQAGKSVVVNTSEDGIIFKVIESSDISDFDLVIGAAVQSALNTKEDDLPIITQGVNGYVLTTDTDGTRRWTNPNDLTALGGIDDTTPQSDRFYSSSKTEARLSEIQNMLDGLAAADIGLGNVDNTADADKPIQTAIEPYIGGTLERNTVLKGGLKLDTVSTKGFAATTYTGDGVSGHSIPTGVDMATGDNGGFVWVKDRSAANGHALTDTVRGTASTLASESDIAEFSSTVNAFNSDGFDTGAASRINANGDEYIAWSFQTTRKATGTTSAGKPYTVHYNPEMGFSVLGWELNGSDWQFMKHHLGDTPQVCISKSRTHDGNWVVELSEEISTTDNYGRLVLNDDSAIIDLPASSTSSTYFQEKLVNYGGATSAGDGIAYCFREVKGFSAFRTYVGIGAPTNSINLDLDMRSVVGEAMIYIKRLDTNGEWVMVDNIRGQGSSNTKNLFANLSDAEVLAGNTDGRIDFTSTGVDIIGNGNDINTAGGQYLIMAFTSNYNKAVDGIPYIEDGTIVTHAEGFDANGAKDSIETKARINCTLGADGTYYVKDDGTLGANAEALDTLTMIGSGRVDTGLVKVLDGKAFEITPQPRTAYTQLLSDGDNEVTIAEIKRKVDEPYIGVDGKLVFAYLYVNADGSISGTSRFNVSAVVKAGVGDYYVYFEKPAKNVYLTPVSSAVTTTLHTAQTVARNENYARVYTFDSSGAKADVAFTLIVMEGN